MGLVQRLPGARSTIRRIGAGLPEDQGPVTEDEAVPQRELPIRSLPSPLQFLDGSLPGDGLVLIVHGAK